MASLTPPRPLTADDDWQSFDCGRDSLNIWFRRHAWNNQKIDVSRISVMRDAQTGAVAGYVSLSATNIERAFLPKARQRNRPDPVPTILLGLLAVDRRYQGQGCARSLMFFALTTAVRISKDLGCFCVLTHPLDEGVQAFYANFGFENLPGDPDTSMAVRLIDLERNGF
jgi:GNAT superfamily N-acetyltransferase